MDKKEEQRIRERAIADLLAKQKRELSEKMSKLGRIRSPAKRKAALKTVKIAQAARWGKKAPK
jgi:hypothetical protein